MSVVIEPTTRWAIGPEAVSYFWTILVSAGSFGTSRVTITFVAESLEMSLVWWSIVSSRSVTSRPNDEPLVTSRPSMRQL